MPRIAVTPDGEAWEVRRLWLPRFRGGHRDESSSFDDEDEDGWWAPVEVVGGEVAEVLSFVAVLVGIVLLVLFLLPYVFFLLGFLAVPFLFVYRIAFRRPWTVEARQASARRPELKWKVVGWRRSGEVVGEIAVAFERGEREPQVRGAELVSSLRE